MSLLNKLFKSKSRVIPVEERISALVDRPAPELQAIATGTTDDVVREAAIKYLPYSPELLSLALKGEPARIQNTAKQRIGELLEQNSLSITQLRSDLNDTDQLFMLASFSAKTSEQLMNEISDENLLLKLSLEAATTHVRQLAAQKIETREVLDSLYKSAKGKDKAVYKIIKNKLDVFKERDALVQTQLAEVESICVDAERHAKKPYDDLYRKLLMQIQKAWQAKEKQSSPELTQRYNVAVEACAKTLSAHQQAEDALKEKERLDAQAGMDLTAAQAEISALMCFLLEQNGLNDAVKDVVKEKMQSVIKQQGEIVKSIKARALSHLDEGLKLYYRRVEDANNLWLKLQETGSLPSLVEALKKDDDQDKHALRQAISQLLGYAKKVDRLPEAVALIKSDINEWEEAQKRKAEKIREDIRSLSGLIRKATWAVEKGFVRKARGVYKELLEKKEKLAGAVPQGVSAKIEQLESDISKLGDWHTFATMPKKESLVQQMESLTEAKLAPKDLADKVHSLQQEWKTLCRGGENQDQEIWQRFQQASDKAYEPAKIFFEQEGQERENNEHKRKDLIAQLEQYLVQYDWENAVWKDVEQTVRLARETWQSYWPVPRKSIKPMQAQFDTLLDKIFQPMNEAYAEGKATRERLVEQAKELAEKEDDVAQQAEQVKNLQNLWKKAGRTRRKDDQALWKMFRAHCDQVFERRQKEYDEISAERDSELSKANDITEEAEAMLSLVGADFFSSLASLDDIKQRFSEVGELPRNKEKSVQARFQKALSNIEKHREKQKRATQEQAWVRWFDTAERLRILELSLLQGCKDEQELQALNELLKSDTQWPSGGLTCLTSRFEEIDSLNASDAQQRESQLRLLCIQAEVIFDVETPDEDKERRMNYQFEKLQQGLGQGGKNDSDINQLTLDWFNIPAVDDDKYQPLYERFMKCRAEALA